MNSRPNSRQKRATEQRVSNYVDTRKYWTKKPSKPNKIQLLIDMLKSKSEVLSNQPYTGNNNRKFTRGRAQVVRDIQGIQSVPVYADKPFLGILLGYRIIEHKRL